MQKFWRHPESLLEAAWFWHHGVSPVMTELVELLSSIFVGNVVLCDSDDLLTESFVVTPGDGKLIKDEVVTENSLIQHSCFLFFPFFA